jgi:hypothetical protein
MDVCQRKKIGRIPAAHQIGRGCILDSYTQRGDMDRKRAGPAWSQIDA